MMGYIILTVSRDFACFTFLLQASVTGPPPSPLPAEAPEGAELGDDRKGSLWCFTATQVE